MVEWAQSNDAGENTIPVYVSWQLNERMYGDLQGLDKQETRDKYGDDQVHIWRRSYDVPPPNGESLELLLREQYIFAIRNPTYLRRREKRVCCSAWK